VENIKDKVGAIFKVYNKVTEDKINEVNKAKLLELLAKEVTKIGLFTVLII
jgi:hypothetical protein